MDATAGNNSNNGASITTPWRTLQKACTAATPNSTVLIRGGTYAENVVVGVSGTAGQPITFRAYGREQVLIEGTGTAGTTLLSISNRSYLRFENLIFQNLTTRNAQGILVETTGAGTSTNLTFKNIIIRHIRWTSRDGVLPSSTDNAQAFIAYGRAGGITNLTLDSCEVDNNVLGFSEAVSLDGNISQFLIQNCRVHDNTNIGIALIGNYGESPNPATDQARNGVVRRNTCYNNTSAYATSGGIYVDGGRDITVDGNRCYHNGYGIEVGAEENGTVENVIVKNNLIYDNELSGLSVGGYTTATTGQVINSTFRNNTLLFNNYTTTGAAEINISKVSNCRFENNVVYTNGQHVLLSLEPIAPQTGNRFDYNCWYTPANNASSVTINWRSTSYSSFASYRAATGQDANSRYANPGLANPVLAAPDAQLQAASTCRDAGNPATVVEPNETDLAGRTRVGNARIDIGALEFTATPLPVQLLRFDAKRLADGVRLSWTTASEQHNAGFLIQASPDGRLFRRIGWVGGQGNRSQPTTYSFVDLDGSTRGAADSYYRLCQIDVDSSVQYSSVCHVPLAGPAETLYVFPNPAGTEVVQVNGTKAGALVQVLDLCGREVLRVQATTNGTAQLARPSTLPPGLYMVQSGTSSARLIFE